MGRNINTLINWLFAKGFLASENSAINALLTHKYCTQLSKASFALIVLMCLSTSFFLYFALTNFKVSTSSLILNTSFGLFFLFFSILISNKINHIDIHKYHAGHTLIGLLFLFAKILISLGGSIYITLQTTIPVHIAFIFLYSIISLCLILYSNRLDMILSLAFIISACYFVAYYFTNEEFILNIFYIFNSILIFIVMTRKNRTQSLDVILFGITVSLFLLIIFKNVLISNQWQSGGFSQNLLNINNIFTVTLFVAAMTYSFFDQNKKNILMLFLFGITLSSIHIEYLMPLALIVLACRTYDTKLLYLVVGYLCIMLSFHIYFINLPTLYKFGWLAIITCLSLINGKIFDTNNTQPNKVSS